MKSNKLNLCICLAAIVAVAVASPRELAGQSASEKSFGRKQRLRPAMECADRQG